MRGLPNSRLNKEELEFAQASRVYQYKKSQLLSWLIIFIQLYVILLFPIYDTMVLAVNQTLVNLFHI